MSLELSRWEVGTVKPVLEATTAHLWRFPLRGSPPVSATASISPLSPDEVQRAGKLITEKLRTRFVVSRICLRTILSYYLNIPAQDILFGTNQNGKPFIENRVRDNLFFNLSHSHDRAVLLVADKKNIGVDLEKVNYQLNCKQIADRYLHAEEKQCLANNPDWRQTRMFYRIWTRKEAVVKAIGSRLADHLGREPVEADLVCRSLFCRRGFVCSLALPDAVKRIRRFDFEM